jgi:hypothetical protein
MKYDIATLSVEQIKQLLAAGWKKRRRQRPDRGYNCWTECLEPPDYQYGKTSSLPPNFTPDYAPWLSIDDDRRATVYIIRACGTSRFKVGVTSDLNRRQRSLQCGSPIPLILVLAIEADSAKQLRVEDTSHSRSMVDAW